MTTIDSPAAVPEVELVIQRGCASCLQTRRFLERHGVPFTIRWLSEPEVLSWITARDLAGRAPGGPPWVVIGDDAVGGYTPDAIGAMLVGAGHTLDDAGPATTGDESAVASSLPAAALWVANLEEGSVGFVDAGRATHLGSVPLGEGAAPMGIGFDPETDIAVVSDFALHRVVVLDRARGGFRGGDLANSWLVAPEAPGDVALDSRRHRFYIPSNTGESLLVLDSTDGSYLGGTYDTAVFPIGRTSNAIAFDPVLDRIFVRSGEGIIAIDAESFSVVGRVDASDADPIGFGRDLKVDPVNHVLYVPGYGTTKSGDEYHHVVCFDARDGSYAFGDAASSVVPTAAAPWTVLTDPDTRLLFVSCMGSESVHAFDADRGRPATDGVQPAVEVGPAARAMALRPHDHTLCVSSFDGGYVTMVDSRTNTYRWHGRSRSTADAGVGPRGMAFVEPPEAAPPPAP
jgi:DNA-binding beta-propeller fold protein YncE